jgi:hypothetical protein
VKTGNQQAKPNQQCKGMVITADKQAENDLGNWIAYRELGKGTTLGLNHKASRLSASDRVMEW